MSITTLILAAANQITGSSGTYVYRHIVLTGSAGAGTNYQVLLKVGESPTATGSSFNLITPTNNFPSAKNNIGDIQFTDLSHNLLSAWVEQVTGSAPNRVAWIWVNVAADLGTNQTIVCRYKNSVAVQPSNGDTTFILFDDFDSGTLDTAKWTLAGTAVPTISSSNITVTGNGSYTNIRAATDPSPSVEVISRKSPAATSVGYVGNLGVFNCQFINGWDTSKSEFWYRIPGNSTPVRQPLSARYQNAFHRIQIGNDLGSTRLSVNGGDTKTGTGTVTTTQYAYIANVYDGGTTEIIDWVAYKKYKTVEPSFQTAYSEKASTVSFPTVNPYVSGISLYVKADSNLTDINGSIFSIPAGVTFTAGKDGNAATVAPGAGTAVGTKTATTYLLNNWTMAVWVYPTAHGVVYQMGNCYLSTDIAHYYDGTADHNIFFTLPLNQWSLLIWTKSSTTGSVVYQNTSANVIGTDVTGTTNNSDSYSNVNFFLGTFPLAAVPGIVGQMDNFVMWNRVLSGAEIDALYNQGNGYFI